MINIEKLSKENKEEFYKLYEIDKHEFNIDLEEQEKFFREIFS